MPPPSIDVSGRPLCVFEGDLPAGAIDGFDSDLAEEFFRAVAGAAKLTLHVRIEAGTNAHHMVEAVFKSFARALRAAVAVEPGRDGHSVNKGTAVIAILDYGMGNLRSVEKALERVGAEVEVTREADRIRAADGLVLPGVGAFPKAMQAVRELGFDALMREHVDAGKPALGICLGMQLLFESSSELGGAEGLGLLEGDVAELDAPGLKVPAHRLERGHVDERHAARGGALEPGRLLPRPFVRAPAGARG